MKAVVKAVVIISLSVSAALALAGPGNALHGEERIELKTEAYPPFSYPDADGTFRGVAVDQVEAAMHDAGIAYGLEMMPWARAITLAETRVDTCVFSTARTLDREHRFKWVAPLSTSRNILVRHAVSSVRAATLGDAKPYTIGTHRSDFTEDLLTRSGFKHLDISADFNATLRKLLEQRIDMMPMADSVYEGLKRRKTPIEEVVTLSEVEMGIACNLGTSDALISRMQASLDRMRQDGRTAEIYRHYGMPLHP